MAGAINIAGTLTGLAQGTVVIAPPVIVPNASNNYSEINSVLAAGANGLTIPSWAVGMLFTPPAGLVTAGQLEITSTIVLSHIAPTLISLDAGLSATVTISNGGATTTNPASLSFF